MITFTPGAGPKVDASGLSVLVVDDSRVNRTVMVGLLQRLGCEADTAADGSQVCPTHHLVWKEAFCNQFIATHESQIGHIKKMKNVIPQR